MAERKKGKYDGRCRGAKPQTGHFVVRFKNPLSDQVHFHDEVYGDVSVANEELDDMILLRSDGSPTYNLTATVDDMAMGVTHVIRGDDHINNTPRQVNLLKALGAALPTYAHVPMILNEHGKRLSKRQDAVSLGHYRDLGIVPAAMLNYLARLGWSHGDQELFTLEELVAKFSLGGIHRSPACFSLKKLVWFNQQHLATLPVTNYLDLYVDKIKALGGDMAWGIDALTVLQLLQGQTKTLQELAEKTLFLYQKRPEITQPLGSHERLGQAMESLQKALTNLRWQCSELSLCMKTVAKEQDMPFSALAKPLRLLLTGGNSALSMDKVLFLLGRERVREALEVGLGHLAKKLP